MDRFYRICTVLIVLLLAVIALRPSVSLRSVYAQSKMPDKLVEQDPDTVARLSAQLAAQEAAKLSAQHVFTYLSFGTGRLEELSSLLTSRSSEGWKVVGVTATGQYNNTVLVILAK
jgi:hypothetical protein